MMSNKLTYKKLYVNSKFRLPQSRSSSDFVIELQENMECHRVVKCGLQKYPCLLHLRQPRLDFMNIYM